MHFDQEGSQIDALRFRTAWESSQVIWFRQELLARRLLLWSVGWNHVVI